MSKDRICEVCNKSFQVKHKSQKGRFCCKTCMDVWQRTCKWEDRMGKERADRVRSDRRDAFIKNNPNNDIEVLRVKSEKMKVYRKEHPLVGDKNPFYGRTHSDELKAEFKSERKGKRFYNEEQFKRQNENTPKGENHPMWKGGISYEPYDPRFNKKFKRQIKERDGNRCCECGKEGKLAIHHIDYNKLNSTPQNCISLCFSCHGKTNVLDRDRCTKYFCEKYKDKLT